MAIKYTYTVYKDFPEATEISETRERIFAILCMLHPLTFIASIICLFVDFYATWPMIFLTILSILSILYLIRYYPVVTEKKIQKAINKRSKMLQEIKDSKYSCKYIKKLNKVKTGTCALCFSKNENIELCKVKNEIGTREIYLCRSCVSKYQDNVHT